MTDHLTHLDAQGRARMVDVGDKPETVRAARATGRVRMSADTLKLALSGANKKGDVQSVAEIAGVMAGKRTSELIPLCHPLPLTKIAVAVTPDAAIPGFTVEATAKTKGQTGVEMEALTAVSVACLTLYDMLKASDRSMTIDGISVLEKSGGVSGDYRRED